MVPLAVIAGLFVLTRSAPGEAALYARRIAGTMLLAFGLATLLLTALLTRAQLQQIAETKMQDLNANDVDAAITMIAGTARSMGVDVEGV